VRLLRCSLTSFFNQQTSVKLLVTSGTFVFLCAPLLLAQSWRLTSAPSAGWSSVASSADGTRLVAASYGGQIFVSTNAGSSWVPVGAPSTWASTASSAEGGAVIATGWGATQSLYISIDSGTTWMPVVTNGAFWGAIASSANETRIVAISYDTFSGGICTFTNAGAFWAPAYASDINQLRSVACSADGSHMAAVARGEYLGSVGLIYTSTNGGATWGAQEDQFYKPWTAIASSADGSKLVAVEWGGAWISTNFGAGWQQTSLPGPAAERTWNCVCSSAEGNRLAAAAGTSIAGPIYLSTDSGDTWTQTDAPVTNWAAIASSADGCKLVGAVNGGGIYTWQTTPHPVLKITASGDNLLLFWIVPSFPFVLQQSSGLDGGWSDVLAQPLLNYTNLNYEVSLPKPTGTVFYRLVVLQ